MCSLDRALHLHCAQKREFSRVKTVSHANICIWWAEVVEFSLIGTKRQLGGSRQGSKYIYFVPQQHHYSNLHIQPPKI